VGVLITFSDSSSYYCFDISSLLICFSCRQSLKDKVKLFTSIEEDKKAIAAKKGLPPPPKRKNRKLASRFATQVCLKVYCIFLTKTGQ
jgi:hypothetical protein